MQQEMQLSVMAGVIHYVVMEVQYVKSSFDSAFLNLLGLDITDKNDKPNR